MPTFVLFKDGLEATTTHPLTVAAATHDPLLACACGFVGMHAGTRCPAKTAQCVSLLSPLHNAAGVAWSLCLGGGEGDVVTHAALPGD